MSAKIVSIEKTVLEIHNDTMATAKDIKNRYLDLFELLLVVDCSVLNSDNHKQWIDLAFHCSCREVERTVAMANPKEAVTETLKYRSGTALELKLGVNEEWAALLTRTKDLMSQKERRNISSEEALSILMAQFCKKNDPVEKAKRSTSRKPKAREGIEVNRSRYRPAEVEHAVDLRDECQCMVSEASHQEFRGWRRAFARKFDYALLGPPQDSASEGRAP